MKVLLFLDDRFSNKAIEIDPATFSFYGHTQGYSDKQADAFIGFVLGDSSKTEEVVAELQVATKLSEEYKQTNPHVGIRIPESYDIDQRPRVWIRLVSGSRGLINPSSFRMQPLERE